MKSESDLAMFPLRLLLFEAPLLLPCAVHMAVRRKVGYGMLGMTRAWILAVCLAGFALFAFGARSLEGMVRAGRDGAVGALRF